MGTDYGKMQQSGKTHALPPTPPSLVLGSLLKGVILGTGRGGQVMQRGRVATLGTLQARSSSAPVQLVFRGILLLEYGDGRLESMFLLKHF